MFYETTFLISSDVDQTAIGEFWENLIKKIQEQGLTVEKNVKPHSRALAYPIKKMRRAYVATTYIRFQKEALAKGDVSKKIREMFSGNPEILRTMLLSVSTLPQPRIHTRRVQPLSGESRLKASVKKPSDEGIGMTKRQGKQEEPLLPRASFEEEIDKKLDEILEDKIGF